MTPARTAAAVLLALTVLVLGGCSSSAGGGDWSRTYLRPFDRVFEATLDSLEAVDFYLVEADAERGEVRADSSVRWGEDITLLVRVEERRNGVVVDVMARGVDVPNGFAPARFDTVVGEYLRELDSRLEGRTGDMEPHR